MSRFELRPTRRFFVVLAPQVAVNTVGQLFSAHKFVVDPQRDLNAVLSGSEWVGVILRRGGYGSDLARIFVDASVETIPFFAFAPGLSHFRGRLRIVILARQAPEVGRGVTELLLADMSPGSDSSLYSRKAYVSSIVEKLQEFFVGQGTLVSGPEEVNPRELPEDHPLSFPGWVQLNKTLKKQKKKH